MLAQRPRHTPATVYTRLVSGGRSPRVLQQLRIPVEVVKVVEPLFDNDVDLYETMHAFDGDINVKWDVSKPSYKKLDVDGYNGTYSIGRYVMKGHGITSIMGWNKDLRDAVLSYGYDQYDINHGLASVIHHYFHPEGLPGLWSVIQRLDAMEAGQYRSTIKDVVIRTLQGSNIPAHAIYNDVIQEDWYPVLRREASKVHQAMERDYPGFVNLAKAKREKDGAENGTWAATAVQMFYQDVEAKIQTTVIAKLAKDFEVKKEDILINCDALFIPKVLGKDPVEMVPILNSIVDYVEYSHKVMAQPFFIPNLDDVLTRVHGTSLGIALDGYHEWKKDFEKHTFYVRDIDRFATLNFRDRSIYYTTWKNLVESRFACHREMVKEWLNDPERRAVDCVVNRPPPIICGSNVFNTWDFSKGFRAANLPPIREGENLEVIIKDVLEMFRCIVSHNPQHYEYLIKFLADSLQNPGIKRAQYIGMYGEQGVGKNELIERFFMDKIVGHDMCVTYKSIANMAEGYETGWQTKSWVLIHEADAKDFTTYNQFLKGITGSVYQTSNVKYGPKISVEFYGRIIMLSNYVNTFSEDSMVSRRQGLRCVASSFRSVPNALETLDNIKVQRAFYDYLMEYPLEGWDPERDRVDDDVMADASFASSFRKEQGNMMMVLLDCGLDKLYEQYRTPSGNGIGYNPVFKFPQYAIHEAYYDICGYDGEDPKRVKNAHVVNMAALITKIGKTILSSVGRQRYPFFRSGVQMRSPSFEANYPALKKAINDRMEQYKVRDHFEMQYHERQVNALLDKYMTETIVGEGWEPCSDTIAVPESSTLRTAHHNRPGQQPAYVIRERGQVVFASDDLEEINKELGHAWVEDGVLHNPHANKDIPIPGDWNKTMVELIYPFYVRDRTM